LLYSTKKSNKSLDVSIILLIFAGRKRSETIMSTKVMIQLIADYFKTQPVLKAWLFGSFARGEETEDSDLDILVEYDKNARISLLTISHMMGELEKSTGRRIDLIEDGCLLPFAVESANRDKVLIYERRG
jgi:predicted nucleotidyltransferase